MRGRAFTRTPKMSKSEEIQYYMNHFDTAERERAALAARLAAVEAGIAALCPTGSEWHNDPDRQLAWIKAELDTRTEIAGERNRLRTRLAAVEAALDELTDVYLSGMSLKDDEHAALMVRVSAALSAAPQPPAPNGDAAIAYVAELKTAGQRFIAATPQPPAPDPVRDLIHELSYEVIERMAATEPTPTTLGDMRIGEVAYTQLSFAELIPR